jgi:hypothetical protein
LDSVEIFFIHTPQLDEISKALGLNNYTNAPVLPSPTENPLEKIHRNLEQKRTLKNKENYQQQPKHDQIEDAGT